MTTLLEVLQGKLDGDVYAKPPFTAGSPARLGAAEGYVLFATARQVEAGIWNVLTLAGYDPNRATGQEYNWAAGKVMDIARERLAGPPQLAIYDNNCATNDPCAICGQRTDPEVGPELFLAGTWQLVCYDCGRHYAPELMAQLEAERQEFYNDLAASRGETAPTVKLLD